MNILMLSPHGTITADPPLGTTDTGGQVVQVLGLAKELGKRGHQVTIANRTWGEASHFWELTPNVELYRVACGPSRFVPKEEIGDLLGAFVDTLLTVVTGKFDVVVGHYWDGMQAARKVADVLDRPLVVMPHSLGRWKARAMGEAHHEEREKAEYEALAIADLAIATSPLQVKVMERQYDADVDRVAVIPPAIDDDFLLNDAMPTPFGPNAVLAVGRAAANKNYLGLVEAARMARARVPDIEVHLVAGSDAVTSKAVLDYANLHGIKKWVQVHDRLSREGLLSAYRGAAVFGMPSLYEPFGMTAAEAMGSGIPALIPSNGGLASMLPGSGGMGWTCAVDVDPRHPHQVAAGLTWLLLANREGAARVARDGQSWARANLSWKRVADDWEYHLGKLT